MFVTAALAAEEAHNSGGGTFPPFDSSTYSSQLFWLALSFGLLYLFLSRTVLPRIAETIETRRDRIAHDLDQAAAHKAEADAAGVAYEQALAEAKRKAGDMASAARDKAKADAEAERKALEDSLNARLAESEKKLAATKAKALADLDTIAEDTTSAIFASVFGTKVTKAEIAAAVKSVQGK